MAKYKIGDKVRIVSERFGGGWNPAGMMDHWLGKVVTIRSVIDGESYRMEEDRSEWRNTGWMWHDSMIAGLANENKMPEVAALLGVEIGEWFDVEGNSKVSYKLTEDGLINSQGNMAKRHLGNLLNGEWRIIKKPWKPEDGDYYHYISPDRKIRQTVFNRYYAFDCMAVYTGNFFRTRAEARANQETIMKKFGWD